MATYRKGILSEPIDLDAPRRAPARTFPTVEAEPGLDLTHRASGIAGILLHAHGDRVTIRDDDGRDHLLRAQPGGFEVGGATVTLVPPRRAKDAPKRTASGSLAAATPARIARASRILVEGIHDAELVEHVWGDDLRAEGVVVQPLHGADDLAAVVRGFDPGPRRRLGILLDHLVTGSKESRLADSARHPFALVCGHPYVDIWQAIRPNAVGIAAWPTIPRGTDWKAGIAAHLAATGDRRFAETEPHRVWPNLLACVRSYADLEPALVGAVEALIDFVTTEG